MKAIKINAPVKLNSGLKTASGAIVCIVEGSAFVKLMKDNLIPCQIITSVFASLQDFKDGKDSLRDLSDFDPLFTKLKLSVASYETLPTQDLLIGAVYEALLIVYPGKVEVIQL